MSWLALALSQAVSESADLPEIGPAPAFSLTTQEGARLTLQDLRGKVVAVTFIYASCTDTCPLLTAKLTGLQARLGTDFGAKVFFVAITVDPERDTPQVLQRYAQAHGANLAGWAFLTGTPAAIQRGGPALRYLRQEKPRGAVDHTFRPLLSTPRGLCACSTWACVSIPRSCCGTFKALVREETRS